MIFRACARDRLPGRPFFCHDFDVACPKEARKAGVFSFDPLVDSTSPDPEDWFPWLANLGDLPRWDHMVPDADLTRIRAWELLAGRVRGVIFNFYESLLGPSPTTGRDRFCELAVIAQEVAVFSEFFGEGQFVRADLETGHPLLRAAMLHHSDDILLLLWRSSEGDEFWIDPARMTRVELFIGLETESDLNAWRMDFPGGYQIPLSKDAKGDVRLHLDSIDLTAKILLTRSKQRPTDLMERLNSHLGKATRFRVEGMDYRLEKVRAIERELGDGPTGAGESTTLREARDLMKEGFRLLGDEDFRDAWIAASQADQLIRTVINQRMVRATAGRRSDEENTVIEMLRRNYFTLPEYYRRSQARDEAVIDEFT